MARRTAILGIVLVGVSCGSGLTDAQLSWCTDLTPMGQKAMVSYPGEVDGNSPNRLEQFQAKERTWKANNPGKPPPTTMVPDPATANASEVRAAAGRLGIEAWATTNFIPGPGQEPSADFIRACRAAYENR